MQLLNLDDSKEAVYGTLDSWVAWEQDFPIAALKNVLITLEKEQQWHRIVQVSLGTSLRICIHASIPWSTPDPG